MSSGRLQVRLLAVTLSAAVVLGAPVAVHAERTVTDDAAGDVVAVTFDADGTTDDEAQFTPAPEATDADITRTVIDHRTKRLRVSVRYRDLGSKSWHFTIVKVRTPDRRFEITVQRDSRRRKGVGSLTRGSSATVDCRGLRWAIAPTTDRVMASVPTVCLGTPRWVRLGVGAVSVDASTDPESVSTSADDGHRTGLVSDKDLRLGAKVHRG